MKKVAVFLSILLITSCSFGSTEEEKIIDPNVEVVVNFEDENLEQYIREQLEIETGDITSFDMKNLKFLIINRVKVNNLIGLEYASELKELILINQTIDSLTPIKNLSKLENLSLNSVAIKKLPIEFNENVNLKALSLSGNKITDVAFLKHMNNLEFLAISDTNLENIEDLQNLINLKQLTLSRNKIKKIDSISSLKKLEKLNLMVNSISNIESLENLSSLRNVTLSYNPIYNLKPLESIPSLKLVVIHLDDNVKHLIYDQVTILEEKGIDVDYTR